MFELPVNQLSFSQLWVIAALLVVVLAALIYERHQEKKRHQNMIDEIHEQIKID